MPIDYKNYPPNWKTEIRPAILKRAQDRCEQCGVPNHALILRSRTNPAEYLIYDSERDCHLLDGSPVRLSEMPDEFDADHYTRVVLTIAHLDHDHTHNDPANLRALCQRCHLTYDARTHAQHAKVTRGNNREAAALASGQLSLFGED